MSVVLTPGETLAAMRELGFAPATTDDLQLDVRTFQAAWLLGTPLVVDGIVGAKTSAAIDTSLAQGRAGAGTASPHFSFAECACHCGGHYRDCRRIKVTRDLLVDLEVLRAAFYPRGLALESVYRCPQHNAACGGKANSMHLYGAAADVPMVARRERVAALRRFTGVGWQRGTLLVRHVDDRGLSGVPSFTPPVSRAQPASWEYCT